MTCESFLLSVALFVKLMNVSAKHVLFLLHTKEVTYHCLQSRARGTTQPSGPQGLMTPTISQPEGTLSAAEDTVQATVYYPLP